MAPNRGKYTFQDVKSWFNAAKNKPLHSEGFPWYMHSHIFVPVNLAKEHWFTLVLNMREKVITCYDSLPVRICCGSQQHLQD